MRLTSAISQVISLFCLAVVSSDLHAGAITNGSFETGWIDGWTLNSDPNKSGPDLLVTPDFYGYEPVDGAFFALLASTNSNRYYAVSQSFDALAQSKIEGNAFFWTFSSLPANAQVAVTIREDLTVLFSADVWSVGNLNRTPWTRFSYTFANAGVYTIDLVMADPTPSSFEPPEWGPTFMGIDAIQLLHPVPEPNTIVIGSILGIGSLITMRCSRKRDS